MPKKGKRSFDTESEKVSPPNKMTRSRRSSESNEILSKLDSIEARFVGIEYRFTNLEKEVAEIRRVLQDIESVRTEVESLKEAISGYQRLEMDVRKRCVLIKGLKFQTRDKFENRSQTKTALAEFFEKINMAPTLVDYHRLGGRRDGEDGSKVCVRIQFVNLDQKFELFDILKEKGREFSDYSVLTDYPSFQQAEFKRLSGQAYELRTSNPGTKTRIVPKGLGLILQRRANNLDRWTTVSQ
jgi:hypothetical protein